MNDQAAALSLTRVRIKKPSLIKLARVAILFIVVVAVIFTVNIVMLIYQSPLMYGLSGGVTLILVVFLLTWPWRRRTVAKVERILSKAPQGDLSSIVQDVTQLLSRTETASPIRELPQVLIKHDRTGETIQVWLKKEPPPIEPLTEVFEPRLLDESDAAFDELALAADSEGEPTDPNAGDSPGHREDLLGTRRVKRNIKLKGGWIAVVGFTIVTVLAGIESLQRGRVTWQFLMWSTALLLKLFLPFRRSLFSTTQWLLVPGGLLLRKAGQRGGGAKLHIFDRSQSVLCAQQLRRGRWLLTVADAEGSETIVATEPEQRLLLRAWLSPLRPPPVEQLIDYT